MKQLLHPDIQQFPRESKPYVYRALAQYFLDELDKSAPSPDQNIQADIHQALTLNPADLDALSLLDNLTPDYKPDDDIKYLRVHHSDLARYYKMSPYTSTAFLHQAKLAHADGQY